MRRAGQRRQRRGVGEDPEATGKVGFACLGRAGESLAATMSPCSSVTFSGIWPHQQRCGAVRCGAGRQQPQPPTAVVRSRLPSPCAAVQRALPREVQPRGCFRDFHRVLTSHRIYGWAQAPKQPAESKRSQQMTPEDTPEVVGSEVRGMLKHKGCKVKQTQAFKDRKIIKWNEPTGLHLCVEL